MQVESSRGFISFCFFVPFGFLLRIGSRENEPNLRGGKILKKEVKIKKPPFGGFSPK
ncbi:hypothetical protein LEP1GSC052_0835 [Leptospira kmetyi serovar Malaysia str. Bejo-Iso9]|nr:hypothetical protein LEP1GSC052_0835 [Leptospira kmetyi serovar Malaysia str. Bejo-Iso9]